ncbi:MAG: ATP-binding protein [Myxococcota bacterium]
METESMQICTAQLTVSQGVRDCEVRLIPTEKKDFVAVIRNITERKAEEMRLVSAKEAAQSASRAKSKFLSKLGDQIRLPANEIMGHTQSLLTTALTPTQGKAVYTIMNSSDMLVKLLNDIVDFLRMEEGDIAPQKLEFHLRSCLDGVGEWFAGRALDKGIEFSMLVRHDVPNRAIGDPGRLRQILINLIGNAIKFTQEGEITVLVRSVRRKPGKITLKVDVKDTGTGIPANSLDRLFEAFSQVDQPGTLENRGTGLGLAISKRLVEAMHGELTIESQEGKGSTFTFTAEFGWDPNAENISYSYAEEIKDTRVLVIDADRTERTITTELLSSQGCVVTEAASGDEATRLLSDAAKKFKPFQLAILSQDGGLELAKQIKSDAIMASVPLLMIASAPTRGDGAIMREAGFSGYLTRPVADTQLLACLKLILGSRQGDQAAAKLPLITQRTLNELEWEYRPRVLLVEDNPISQKSTVRLLAKRGYRCDLAINSLDALEAVADHRYASHRDGSADAQDGWL